MPQTLFSDKKGQDKSKGFLRHTDPDCIRNVLELAVTPGKTAIMTACAVGVLAGFLLL